MSRSLQKGFLSILFLVFTMGAYTQDSLVVFTKKGFKGDRPKIGLVLSGGGAKGIAHIGFLRVMESAGIQPDFITGTSMGSLVGALYAIGFSVDSIQKLVDHQDWNSLLSNKIDYRRVNMEEKDDYGEYFAELPFNGWKPGLPSGAIKGQELELLFERLTISAVQYSSFDQFYIPYRAVATDLLTGKAYVFKDGPLSIAMRSSMSIPTIMQPVKKDSMLLVDGGLVENFPVRVVLDMGADIVIGVYTGGQLLPEEELTSLLAILKQSSLMRGILDAQKQKKNVDIYIEPPLNDMSATDFNSSKEFIQRGYKAALDKKDELVALANYMKQFNVKLKERPKLLDSIYVSEIDYSKIQNKKYRNLVKRTLESEPNVYLTSEQINDKIRRLYGTRLFRKVGYHFENIDSVSQRLVYNVIPRKQKYLNLAIQYRNESKIGVIINNTFRNVFIPMSKLDLKFRISEFPAARLRYFTYLDYNTKFGVSASYNYFSNDLPVYINASLESKYTRHLRYSKIKLSYFPGISSSFNLYGRYEVLNFKKKIAPDLPEITDIRTLGWFTGFSYIYNTFDKKYFTSSGLNIEANVEANFGTVQKLFINKDTVAANPGMLDVLSIDIESFIQASLQFDAYKKLNKKWVMSNEAFLIASSLKNMELVSTYYFGGMYASDPRQREFWGLPENTIFMNNGAMYRLGFRYHLVNNLFVAAKINALFSAEDITLIFDATNKGVGSYLGDFANYIIGYGAEVSYRSPIGPISLGISLNDSYSALWTHFRLGFNF